MSSFEEKVREAREAVDKLDNRIERKGYPDSEAIIPTADPVIGKNVQIEKLKSVLDANPSIDGAWYVLANEKSVPSVAKNVLWQDMIAAWNRRKVISNDDATLLLTIRYRD